MKKLFTVGRYTDVPIDQVPSDFLVWVATRSTFKNPEAQQMARDELKERGHEHLLPSPVKIIKVDTTT